MMVDTMITAKSTAKITAKTSAQSRAVSLPSAAGRGTCFEEGAAGWDSGAVPRHACHNHFASVPSARARPAA